ncbi:MAG: hypothetical protein AB7V08_13970 [Elusimicrobiales bacterium]
MNRRLLLASLASVLAALPRDEETVVVIGPEALAATGLTLEAAEREARAIGADRLVLAELIPTITYHHPDHHNEPWRRKNRRYRR